MIRELVLATRNQHKVEELVALLGDLGVTIRTLDEFPDAPDVVEDGDTCEANAVKKARVIAEFTGFRLSPTIRGSKWMRLVGGPVSMRPVMPANMRPTKTTVESCCRT